MPWMVAAAVEHAVAREMRGLVLFILSVALWIAPWIVLYGVYWLLSLPLRRRERARLFLDVLELGAADGHSPEQSVVRASDCGDRMLGARFHRLAAHVRSGESLAGGLKKVPRLLPPAVSAMLDIGSELGDVRRVLPACRQTLDDALSQTRGALNYLAILAFVILPAVPVLTLVVTIFVLPKFQMIAMDMGTPIPAFSQAVFGFGHAFVVLQFGVMLFFQCIILGYVAGPRLRRWLGVRPVEWLVDELLWRLPWRRQRMQRDFATMLALLLDTGVPEERALRLAATASNSPRFIRRAGAAAEEIARGVKLTDAVRALDSSAELHWRLDNAAAGMGAGTGGFVAALRGWFELLDARAFQQEQAAAQTLTTALVLWNGLAIGLLVTAIFNVLTGIVEGGVLW